MTYRALEAEAETRHLTVLGGFHPHPQDKAPTGTGTLLLLGPHEPTFWPAFQQSPEWQDGAGDPVDRWSRRVIGDLAKTLDAHALFPFGGPPHLPFFSWALHSRRLHMSPIRLLVHDTAGLWVSFRGALALPERIALPQAPPSPCASCAEKPCLSACPVEAFDRQGYDVPACKKYLETSAGSDCMDRGCAARRACPVSKTHPRHDAQSAYHMTAFKG